MSDDKICAKCNSTNVMFSKKREKYICEDCEYEWMETQDKPRLRVFISYGRDEFMAIAERIKNDLNVIGHEVWFDKDRLKEGCDWEDYIDKGLNWVSEDPQNGRIIFIMTPHSVRRPDGYCLNEIAKALTKLVTIIPVMLITSEPPLSIYRLQYLDMRDCIPLHQRENIYQSKALKLTEVLEENRLDYNGIQTKLINLLEPIVFDAEINKHLENFTGRSWVEQIVKEWLYSKESSRIFWLTGGPGVGKTAISVWLLSHLRECAAFHLCDFGHKIKADPRKLVTSIAYQLTTQIPEYFDRLNSMNINKIDLEKMDAKTLFDYLIVQPLSAQFIRPDRTILLIIDALDEATFDGNNNLAEFISSEFNKTPLWMKLFITSRPDSDIMFYLQELTPYILDTSNDLNLNDLKVYLRKELKDSPQIVNNEKIVENIIQKSEGIILYLKYVIEEIKLKRLDINSIDQFPKGLGGVYVHYFRRQFENMQMYKEQIKPMLRVIVAAMEPLKIEVIRKIFNLNREEWNEIYRVLSTLFPTSDGMVKIHHKSIIDWITDESKAGKYFIDIFSGHKVISDFYLKQYAVDKTEIDDYGITYFPDHLFKSEKFMEINRVMTDLEYLEIRIKRNNVYDLLSGFSSILKSKDCSKTLDAKIIGMYYRFIKAKSHILSLHPNILINLAVNEPKDSLISINAQAYFNEKSNWRLWFKRLNPEYYDKSYIMTLSDNLSEVACCNISVDGKFIIVGLRNGILKVWDSETGACKATLVKHDSQVRACSFFPDGKRIISCSEDKKIKIWDSASGILIKIINSHNASIEACSFSGDGRKFATCSVDGVIKIWDSKNLKEILTIRNEKGYSRCCYFSHNGSRLITGNSDNNLLLWDATNGTILETLSGHKGEIRACAFSTDESYALTASYDKTLILWDIQNLQKVKIFRGHNSIVRGCRFMNGDKWVVSGSEDGTVRIWDIETGSNIKTIYAHNSWITSLCISKDESLLITGADDKNANVWDLLSIKDTIFPLHEINKDKDKDKDLFNENICKKTIHGGPVFSCTFSPDGTKFMTTSADNTLKLWDAFTCDEITTFKGHSRWVRSFTFSPDNSFGVSCSNDGKIISWSIIEKRMIKILYETNEIIFSVCFSPNGKNVLASTQSGKLIMIDFNFGKIVKAIETNSTGIRSCCYSPDGKRIASGGDDMTVIIWNAETFSIEKKLEEHTGTIRVCVFTPDSKYIITASEDGYLFVWDLETGTIKNRFGGNNGVIYDFNYNSVEQEIVSASADGNLLIWSLKTGQLIAKLEGHKAAVWACAYSPDGRTILSASFDTTIKLWDRFTNMCIYTVSEIYKSTNICRYLKNGKFILHSTENGLLRICDGTNGSVLTLLNGHEAPVIFADFYNDNNTILTASKDNKLILWDLLSGKPITIFEGHTAAVRCCKFSPDGKKVLSSSNDRKVILWDLLNGKADMEFIGHQDWATQCGFIKNSSLIYTAGLDGKIIIWDSANGKIIKKYIWNNVQISDISISNEQNILLCSGSTNDQGKWLIWKFNQCDNFAITGNMEKNIKKIFFSSDNAQFVCCSDDGTISLFDTCTGKLLKEHKTQSIITDCKYSTDEKWILYSCKDSTMNVINSNTFEIVGQYCFNNVINNFDLITDQKKFAAGDDKGFIYLMEIKE